MRTYISIVGHLRYGVQARDGFRPQPMIWRASSQCCIHMAGSNKSLQIATRANRNSTRVHGASRVDGVDKHAAKEDGVSRTAMVETLRLKQVKDVNLTDGKNNEGASVVEQLVEENGACFVRVCLVCLANFTSNLLPFSFITPKITTADIS